MTKDLATAVTPKARRRAMISSFFGTTVEFYDFLLYGTAASLVFPSLFFPGDDQLVSTLSSFGTLAVGYVARPIGAVLFGHFGDRFGRKKMLVVTLMIMGLTTICMGLLPTFDSVGILAPILLIVLRVVQGLAVGGEWAGAALMSMEHAKPKNKGFAASLAAAGSSTGAVLATLILTPFSLLPEGQFLGWGWRVPFLLSAVLVVIGFLIRRSVTESPEFTKAQIKAEEEAKKQIPLFTVFRRYPLRVLSGAAGAIAPLFIQSIMATFVLNYALLKGYSYTQALALVTIANAIHSFTIPLSASITDRVGRRPVMIVGSVVGMILIWPMFYLINLGQWWALLLAFIIGNPIIQAIMYGPLGAWIGEKFPADVRYSGTAVTYQIGTTIGAGFAPLIATSLLQAAGGSDPTYVIWFFIALCIISGLAYLFSRESHQAELSTTTVGKKNG